MKDVLRRPNHLVCVLYASKFEARFRRPTLVDGVNPPKFAPLAWPVVPIANSRGQGHHGRRRVQSDCPFSACAESRRIKLEAGRPNLRKESGEFRA